VSRVLKFRLKGAQETNGGQVQGEPELVVHATPRVHKLTVGIVEVKVAGKLLVRWRPDKPYACSWASVRNSPGIGAEAYRRR
jgi:hypothetical protein